MLAGLADSWRALLLPKSEPHVMKTYEYEGTPFADRRSHPWTDQTDSPECRYYDLTLSPEHIRTSLEDFSPWNQYAAVEEFYVLLTRLSHPTSVLESNDCQFTGPSSNDNPAFEAVLECSGRVMVLFRELERNTARGQIERLTTQLHRQLAVLDAGLDWGVIGTTVVPVRYLALAPGEQLGSQLMISFWAWGTPIRKPCSTCSASLAISPRHSASSPARRPDRANRRSLASRADCLHVICSERTQILAQLCESVADL